MSNIKALQTFNKYPYAKKNYSYAYYSLIDAMEQGHIGYKILVRIYATIKVIHQKHLSTDLYLRHVEIKNRLEIICEQGTYFKTNSKKALQIAQLIINLCTTSINEI